jgi:sugar/nucleoside kinase (ribokinase family)
MSILVVGSVAFDTVETPFGRAERVLGGSASFFSVAASFFVPVSLVGVVGSDFGEKELAAFRDRPIDLEGLERMEGETFHWQGKYSYDLNSRETIRTDLNVFEHFKPKIPPRYRRSDHVFLGNIDPVLQRQVLDQVERPRLVACDTMNFWISGAPEDLRQTLSRVDVLLINDAEARQLSGEWNIVKAARAIRALGPRTLVIKKGEHGVLMFGDEGSFAAPAYPLEEVFDPTGAGDTFAGGFLGYLAGASSGAAAPVGPAADDVLRRAVVMGSTLASFCVEAFSLDRLLRLTRPEIDERFRLFKRLTQFEAI